jgi:hypothetical protein
MVGAFLIVALAHVPVVEAVGRYRFIFTPIALYPPRVFQHLAGPSASCLASRRMLRYATP